MTQLRLKQWPVYVRLMRADKPIGTYLLAWPTLWALWIAAEGIPSIRLLAVFLLGVFFMRSAGCVVNDYADRKIDAHVARTANRPFARGEVSEREAIELLILLLFCAANLLWLTNGLTVRIALLAVSLAIIYPFMKRYTQLPQVVLGAAFSCSIPMAFAATTNTVPIVAWWLFLAVVIWVVVYDTFYAMVDREDDIEIGVKSTAILFGRYDIVITTSLQIIFLILMFAVGTMAELGLLYFACLLWVAKLFRDQQAMVRQREKSLYFDAFLHNNRVGMAVFVGIFLHYLLN